ncbi:biopolymer transporter ExbD [Bdellovibrionota bacterium FG-2]
MSFRKSIRGRRGRKRVAQHFELQLTSMMDMLIIIVVFLLKSYSTATNQFGSAPGLQLPYSFSPDSPPDSLHLILTPEAMTFENERILEFMRNAGDLGSTEATYSLRPSDLDEGGRRVIPLYDALIKARNKSELLRAKSPTRDAQGNPLPFEGVLAIQADKRVRYDTIRRVMYTAGAAGYKVFRFLAQKRE